MPMSQAIKNQLNEVLVKLIDVKNTNKPILENIVTELKSNYEKIGSIKDEVQEEIDDMDDDVDDRENEIKNLEDIVSDLESIESDLDEEIERLKDPLIKDALETITALMM